MSCGRCCWQDPSSSGCCRAAGREGGHPDPPEGVPGQSHSAGLGQASCPWVLGETSSGQSCAWNLGARCFCQIIYQQFIALVKAWVSVTRAEHCSNLYKSTANFQSQSPERAIPMSVSGESFSVEAVLGFPFRGVHQAAFALTTALGLGLKESKDLQLCCEPALTKQTHAGMVSLQFCCWQERISAPVSPQRQGSDSSKTASANKNIG